MNSSTARIRLLAWQLACLVGLAPLAQAQNAEQNLRAKIVAYASGSAFAVLDGGEKLRRVKLSGVDAPEQRQAYAQQARQLAAEWLGSGPIEIVVDKTDKDQRIHGRVTRDGRDVGLQLLEAGLAWCDPDDAAILSAAVRETYQQACDAAKKQRRGLWRDANPMPPWEHRKIPQFDPLPGSERAPGKQCQEIGYQTLQCDDGKTYRSVGSQIIGSDGTVYTRRGNTITGTDGNHFEQQGTSSYGSDGSICRSRGRRVDCY